MTKTIVVTLDQSESLAKRFNRLADDVKKTIAQEALYPAAAVIMAQEKANAPVASGALRQAIRIVEGQTQNDEITAVNVEINSSSFTSSAFYPAYLELGWRAGARRSTVRRGAMVLKSGRLVRQKVRNKNYGKERNWIPGTHFIEKSFNQSSGYAAEVALSRMAESIEREAGK